MSDVPPYGPPVPQDAAPAQDPPPVAAGQPLYATPGAAWAVAPPPPRQGNVGRGFKLGGMIAGLALCGLAVLGYFGYSFGPVGLGVGMLAAVLPVPVLVLCFLWLDRYEPEPLRYLGFCFAWGATAAAGTALAINTGTALLFRHYHISDNWVITVVAPVVEETAKAAGPLLLFLLRRKTFSGLIDGIVYCGLSATGFAMSENILYLGGYGYARNAAQHGALAGVSGVFALFFVRILLTGFAHPLFTSMTGIGLGIAARRAGGRARWFLPVAGLPVAMLLHGSFNGMSVLTATTRQAYVMLYGYVAVMMPIFFGMVGFALWLRSSEGRLAERMLTPYVQAGWLSPPEVVALGTLGRRLAARRWAKRVAGEAGAKAMRAYQFEATRLALLRDGMRRGLGTTPTELPGTLDDERRLLGAIVAYRRVFAGRDPNVPRAFWDGMRYHVAFPDGAVRPVEAPAQPVVPVPVTLVRPMAPYPYR